MTNEVATKVPSIAFRVDGRTPEHTTFRVFTGPPLVDGVEATRASAGLLTLRNDEFDVLAPILLAAPQMLNALLAILPWADAYEVAEEEGATIERALQHEKAVKDARAAIEACRSNEVPA